MFVRLLKCPKSRLESEQHPRVPLPMYSDCSAFQALPIAVLPTILNKLQFMVYERE